MPLKIPKELPAYNVLSKENIFVMNVERASHQDIRPLKIGILNLMPIKIQAENQLLRYLSINFATSLGKTLSLSLTFK